jgi:hypothetical protein
MVKNTLNPVWLLAWRMVLPLRLPTNTPPMKQTILPLLAFVTFALTSCERDPLPLDLAQFDVRWYDDDGTSTQTLGDALVFDIIVNTTDNDPDDQFITEWEFSYTVNNKFGGILQGDENTRTNSLTFEGEVFIQNLTLPGPGSLEDGDVVEFRLWCIDNCGTQVEQFHRYVIEE